MTGERENREDIKAMKKGVLPIAAGICAAAVIVMIIALTCGGGQKRFSLPPFDSAAQEGQPKDDLQNVGYGEIDAKAFRFLAAGKLTVENGKTDVWLTNLKENTVWLKVRVVDEKDNVLGESGLVRPGEYVRSVKLHSVPKESIPVSLKIMAYEPETYYSAGYALLNTTLNIR